MIFKFPYQKKLTESKNLSKQKLKKIFEKWEWECTCINSYRMLKIFKYLGHSLLRESEDSGDSDLRVSFLM